MVDGLCYPVAVFCVVALGVERSHGECCGTLIDGRPLLAVMKAGDLLL